MKIVTLLLNWLKERVMTIATLFLNWLIVCVFCMISMFITNPLPDLYQNLFEGQALPPITNLLIYNPWKLWKVPLIWSIATIILLFTKNTQEKTLLHTSASILLGLCVFFIVIMAATLPFVQIITPLAK